jgi:hypothetical protein
MEAEAGVKVDLGEHAASDMTPSGGVCRKPTCSISPKRVGKEV